MSPLASLLLRAMRACAIAGAAFVLLVIGIELWKRWNFGGFGAMGRQDVSFLVILVILLGGLLWLARAMGKELRNQR